MRSDLLLCAAPATPTAPVWTRARFALGQTTARSVASAWARMIAFGVLLVMASAGPAAAQYSLGTNHTPFTSAGQAVTLSFVLGNSGTIDALANATLPASITNPSCANPILIPARGTTTCTGTYTTVVADVAADGFNVTSQWDICRVGEICPGGFTDRVSNTAFARYVGVPIVSGGTLSVPYNSTGTSINLNSNVIGVKNAMAVGTTPRYGTVLASGTTFTYTPTPGFYGVDSFTFTATNANGTSPGATITVTVGNPPAPQVAAHADTVPYNTAKAIDLTTKITGVFTSAIVATTPGHGTATFNGAVVTYTPTTGYVGPDTFSYTATGPGGTSTPAIVTLTVLPPPPPATSTLNVSVPFNTAKAIDLTPSITGVYSSVAVATPPGHGTTAVSGSIVTYTPTTGYSGPDTFTYTATGPGGTSTPATVNITVLPSTAPTVTATTVTVPFNTTKPIDLTSKITGTYTSLTVANAPAKGSTAISGSVVSYTPTTGYVGADSFTYTATGPGGTSAPATVSITVLPPNAPTAADHSVSVLWNTTKNPIDLTSKVAGTASTIAVAAPPANGSVTVSGLSVLYTPQAGYLGADNFTYTATGPGGTSSAATVSIAVTKPAVSSGWVTVSVASPGIDGTFSFTSTLPGNPSFSITTVSGSATRTFQNIAPGAYSVTQASTPSGVALQSVQSPSGTTSGATANLTVASGAPTTVTFTQAPTLDGIKNKTEATVRNFMSSRANAILSGGPDTSRNHARFGDAGADNDQSDAPRPPRAASGPISGPGDGAGPRSPGRFASSGLGHANADGGVPSGSGVAKLSGNMEDGNGRVSFSTSLNQMRRAAVNDAYSPGRMNLGGGSGKPAIAPKPALFDIWLEAHTTRFEDNSGGGKRRGNMDIVYLGADYVLNKSLLIGAMVQFDRAREASTVLGSSAEGTGWMIGPYVTARLTKNVFLDARAAWGKSSNQVNALGSFTDSFETTRGLASAKLTGNWTQGAWRFSPSAEIAYYQEQQKGFTSVSGAAISDQQLALGRMTIGPEVGYRVVTENGGVFEPYAAAKLLWDFKKDTTVSIGGMDVTNSTVRGKIEAGAGYTDPSGVTVKGSVAYDGIGDKNYNAYQGKLQVGIPLQ